MPLRSGTGFPQKTPQHHPLLLILQILSHMTTSGLLSSRGDLLSPEPSARAHPSPRPTADQRPPPSARKPPARRTPEDPRVPGPEHLCPLSTDTRAQSNRKSPARLQARAPRPRRGPRMGTMVRVLQVCKPRVRTLLTVHLRGASASREAPSRSRLQPAPGGACLSFTLRSR